MAKAKRARFIGGPKDGLLATMCGTLDRVRFPIRDPDRRPAFQAIPMSGPVRREDLEPVWIAEYQLSERCGRLLTYRYLRTIIDR